MSNKKQSNSKIQSAGQADTDLSRRSLLKTALAGGVLAVALPSIVKRQVSSGFSFDVTPSEFDEISVADLQSGMKSGKFTAHSITEHYLARIDAIDKRARVCVVSSK